MSTQPTQPLPTFRDLAALLHERLADYLDTAREIDARWCDRDGSGPDLTDLDNQILDHAWAVHNLAAEIGKATP